MIDHTKVLLSSEFNSYKNINVYPASVAVTNVPFVGRRDFQTDITVEPGTRFAFVKVQTNHAIWNGSSTVPTALRWSMLGSGGSRIAQSLSIDPSFTEVLELFWSMRISGNTVSFILTANNPNVANHAFVPINIGIEYATFTTDN